MDHLQIQIDELNSRIDAITEQYEWRLQRLSEQFHMSEDQFERRLKRLQDEIWSLERKL